MSNINIILLNHYFWTDKYNILLIQELFLQIKQPYMIKYEVNLFFETCLELSSVYFLEGISHNSNEHV
jgi:hypothetical protein